PIPVEDKNMRKFQSLCPVNRAQKYPITNALVAPHLSQFFVDAVDNGGNWEFRVGSLFLPGGEDSAQESAPMVIYILAYHLFQKPIEIGCPQETGTTSFAGIDEG